MKVGGKVKVKELTKDAEDAEVKHATELFQATTL